MVAGALAAIRNERSGRICAHAFDSRKIVNILPFSRLRRSEVLLCDAIPPSASIGRYREDLFVKIYS